jgi:Fe2+ transport system protein FeoA
MPHYTVGHLDRVAAAEAALAPYPALRIAGGAYRGVGLPDCIGQGRAAADAVASLLSGGAAVQPVVRPGVRPGVRPVAEPVATRHGLTLDTLPVGRSGRILSIDGDQHADLALEGLLPGTAVAVASRAPLGGPLVVGIGRARIAVARSVAATIPVAIDPVADVAAEVAG